MKISLYDFLTKFCDLYQIITVIVVDANEEWCKFTDIRSMPVFEVSAEEKFKDILEMSVLGIHINGSQGIDAELCIEVKEEASHEGYLVPR